MRYDVFEELRAAQVKLTQADEIRAKNNRAFIEACEQRKGLHGEELRKKQQEINQLDQTLEISLQNYIKARNVVEALEKHIKFKADRVKVVTDNGKRIRH